MGAREDGNDRVVVLRETLEPESGEKTFVVGREGRRARNRELDIDLSNDIEPVNDSSASDCRARAQLTMLATNSPSSGLAFRIVLIPKTFATSSPPSTAN